MIIRMEKVHTDGNNHYFQEDGKLYIQQFRARSVPVNRLTDEIYYVYSF